MRRQYAHRAPIGAICEGSSMRLYRAICVPLDDPEENAGGTRHRSPMPIYPLGLDKTNFPRIQENIFILSSGRN